MGTAMPQKIDELYNKWLGYNKTYYQVSPLINRKETKATLFA
jgi:hypothetical protein